VPRSARPSPYLDALGGLLVVDKSAGWTSHDVVGRVRRLAATRRVGHAGTLDPMATGVLVLGLERATRLLGHLALGDKAYDATIRLGEATVTDDAEGEVTASADASGVDEAAVRAGLAALTGEIDQVPSSVSAVKVGGVRSYARVRGGEEVVLAARRVTVSRLDLSAVRREGPRLDLDVSVVCTSGTYVRALARDLGAALGVGGHLTALRRTRVGPFGLAEARTLDDLAALADEGRIADAVLPLGAAVAATFPRRDVAADQARTLSHGGRLPASGSPGPVGVFDPDGRLLALVEDAGGVAKPLVVFAPAG
jgi:tRNA pseudouridine55 synthase